ncbi:MAG: right-handed parallel beta-helix repeat-containing protein, partial [Actinobacteria bacterium]|nr:right-handed parallel beta-helix repeat-containing protein [Actinomycetota bacterium]
MRKRMRLLAVIVAVALAAIAFGPGAGTVDAAGNTRYVSPGGDNSNPGTLEFPWADPGYASLQIESGDTLVILGGTYYLNQYDADIISPPSGVPGAWTTVRGEEGNRPVLAGGGNLIFAIDLSGRSYVSVENLEITSDGGAPFREAVNATGGPLNQCLLKDLYIHHVDEFGVDIADTRYLEIADCVIEYCGFGSVGGPDGVQGGWRDVVIRGCELSYNGHYYQGGPGPSPYARPDGFGIEESSGPIEITSTTAKHNRGDGLDSKASNTNIHECVVANNS